MVMLVHGRVNGQTQTEIIIRDVVFKIVLKFFKKEIIFSLSRIYSAAELQRRKALQAAHGLS